MGLRFKYLDLVVQVAYESVQPYSSVYFVSFWLSLTSLKAIQDLTGADRKWYQGYLAVAAAIRRGFVSKGIWADTIVYRAGEVGSPDGSGCLLGVSGKLGVV